jgi:hypothetical protein
MLDTIIGAGIRPFWQKQMKIRRATSGKCPPANATSRTAMLGSVVFLEPVGPVSAINSPSFG